MIAFSGPHLFAGDTGTNGRLERWQTWDFAHFDQIAVHGYFAPWRAPVEAFFPGLPLLMRGGLDVGIPTVVTGLIVSAIATAVAVVALARLAELEYGRAAARLSAVVWLAAPVAFFLTAPYTEAPFLAFAIPAWLAARKDRWLVACLLAAGACLFRVSALFLVAALGVQFLTTRDWRRPREIAIRLPLFLIPLVPLGAYMAYLHAHTGDWLSWYHAQEVGWYRQFTPPWTALEHTWQAVGGAMGFGAETTQGTIDEYAWMFAAEIVAVVIGLIATVALLVHRRWGEATWVGTAGREPVDVVLVLLGAADGAALVADVDDARSVGRASSLGSVRLPRGVASPARHLGVGVPHLSLGRLSRTCPGGRPVAAFTWRERWLAESNPHRAAMDASGRSLPRSSPMACRTRTRRTKVNGATPATSAKCARRVEADTPTADARATTVSGSE